MNQQATGLEKDVEYIKTDIADMKIDIRRLNEKTDGIIASVSAVRAEMKESIGAVRAEMKESIGAVRVEIGAVRTEMEKSIGALRVSLFKMQVWAVLLYVGLAATLFYVLARGFKWL